MRNTPYQYLPSRVEQASIETYAVKTRSLPPGGKSMLGKFSQRCSRAAGVRDSDWRRTGARPRGEPGSLCWRWLALGSGRMRGFGWLLAQVVRLCSCHVTHGESREQTPWERPSRS